MHRSSRSSFVFATAVCLTAFSLRSQSAYVTQTANDEAGNPGFSSFTNGLHWSELVPPHSGTNYLVSGGLMLRTPENANSYTFAGDSLTISNAFVNLKGTGQITISDFRLYGCRIANGTGTTLLYGTGTVAGTSSGYSRFSGSNDRTTRLYSSLQGSGELSVDRTEGETPGGFTVELRGDNSAFAGGLRVVGPNIEISLMHTNGLGGALGTFRPDALSLVSNGSLYVASSMTLATPNRGIAVSNAGALRVTGANALLLRMPVSGNGTLLLNGDGRFDLDSALNHSGDTVASASTVRINPGFSMSETSRIIMKSGTRHLEGGGFVANATLEGGAINPATGAEVGQLTVSNLTFSGGGLKYDFARGSSSDFVRVTGLLSNALATPIPVTFTGLVTNELPSYALVAVPGSQALATNQFALTKVYADLPNGYLEVRPTDGTNTLWFVQTYPIIQLMSTDPSGSTSFTSGTRWSDGAVPSAAKDYLVAGPEMRSPDSSSSTATFSGHSLTLTSGSLKIKNAGVTISDLRLRGGAFNQGGGALVAYLNGKAVVDAPASSPFSFEIESTAGTTRTLDILSTISGTGDLRFRFVASGSSLFNGGAFTLKGTNTAFLGGITVVGARGIEVGITDERNLGGNPAAFRADLLRLSLTGVLYAASSLTIDDPNRGIYLETNGVFRVESTNALTLATPVAGTGLLVKRGAGTLVLAGTNTYAGGTLVESNGTLEVRSQWALGTNTVTFGTNTTLRIPYDAAALPLGVRLGGAAPLATTGPLKVVPLFGEGSLPKSFDMPLFLLTQAASMDTSALRLQNTPKGYSASVATKSVDDSGTPRTQIYLRYRWAGLALLVQ